MKKFSMLCAAALSVVALPASAALQYSLQTGTGEAWFSVDSKQTVYVDVKKNDGSNVSIGDSVISNIGWYNYNDVAPRFSLVTETTGSAGGGAPQKSFSFKHRAKRAANSDLPMRKRLSLEL